MMAIPWWLQVWVTWMRNDQAEISALGFPAKSLGLAGGWARGSNYWDDMEVEQDSELACAVDAAVNAQEPGYKAAITWVVGLQSVAKPRRLEEAFTQAVVDLEMRIRRKGIVV